MGERQLANLDPERVRCVQVSGGVEGQHLGASLVATAEEGRQLRLGPGEQVGGRSRGRPGTPSGQAGSIACLLADRLLDGSRLTENNCAIFAGKCS